MEKITIMDVAAEGKAIAKVNDLVIFVPYVVPGDVVDLQIKRKKNKYAEAEAVKFHELSPNRAVPFCQHYGVCGGCKWQVLPYPEQIRYKQKQVEDNLSFPRFPRFSVRLKRSGTETNWSSHFPINVG